MTSVNWIELNSHSIALISLHLLIYLYNILQSVSCELWAKDRLNEFTFPIEISLKFEKHAWWADDCWLSSCPLSSRVVNSYFKKLELPFVVDIRHPRNEIFIKFKHTRNINSRSSRRRETKYSWNWKIYLLLLKKWKYFCHQCNYFERNSYKHSPLLTEQFHMMYEIFHSFCFI